MKRIFSLTLLLILVALCLIGCEAEPSKELSEILKDINTSCNIENAEVLSDVKELETRYMIESSDVSTFAAEVSSDNNDLHIVFVKACDEESAQAVYSSLNSFYHSQLDIAQTYDDEYAKLLSDCSVERDGNYVSMIIADNAKEIKDTYNSFFE
ncbi:MAG: DUF4358 domain-containing protein [Eubacteriales bacterium]|nr:DUF4358 domain-containing protein [Eubacteriales bacterium]